MTDLSVPYLKRSGPRVVMGITTGGAKSRYEAAGIPTRSPMFRTRAEAEQWLRAELAKTPSSMRARVRPCMCCAQSFQSAGAHNRLCDTCRRRPEAAIDECGFGRRSGRG